MRIDTTFDLRSDAPEGGDPGRDSPRLTAEQRVRRAARCQAAHRRVSVIRHQPAYQRADRLDVDRNLVAMKSLIHSWSRSHRSGILQLLSPRRLASR